jgi:hypothetical protein
MTDTVEKRMLGRRSIVRLPELLELDQHAVQRISHRVHLVGEPVALPSRNNIPLHCGISARPMSQMGQTRLLPQRRIGDRFASISGHSSLF